MLDTLLLIGGLALILLGANGLTDGSAAVAKRFRISDLVIGLTIVAFGTSAPELVISVLSALNGSAEMAIGNVVGSNTFNALMIIGCTAVVLPIKVGEGTMSKEIPLVILSSLVLFFCANDVMLDQGNENIIGRIDGLILLAFFLIFLRYTFAIARNGGEEVYCPVAGCQRICYRIDFGGRRYFVARAGHICYGCIEEESGYCHRKCDR